jgi:hypothetical protein
VVEDIFIAVLPKIAYNTREHYVLEATTPSWPMSYTHPDRGEIMPGNEYNTVSYQRSRMWNALGVAFVCFIGLGFSVWLRPQDFIGYIMAFGVVIGIRGFFDHRRYMKELQLKESTEGAQHA